MSYDHPSADDASLEDNDQMALCPACGEPTYDTTEDLCDNILCRYAATCNECGTAIAAIDYDPEHRSFCSAHCLGEAIAAEWAELTLDR